MAKPGRPSTLLDRLDESTRARILEAIKSEQTIPYIDLYRRFALEQYGIKANSFERFARRVREDHQADAGALPLSLPAPSFGEGASSTGVAMATIMRVLERANQLLDANDVKALPHISMMVRSCADLIRLGFDETSEKRAAELHEKRLAKLEPEVKAAIAENQTQGSRDLRSILERVASNVMPIDDAVREIGDVLWIEIDKQMRGVK